MLWTWLTPCFGLVYNGTLSDNSYKSWSINVYWLQGFYVTLFLAIYMQYSLFFCHLWVDFRAVTLCTFSHLSLHFANRELEQPTLTYKWSQRSTSEMFPQHGRRQHRCPLTHVQASRLAAYIICILQSHPIIRTRDTPSDASSNKWKPVIQK